MRGAFTNFLSLTYKFLWAHQVKTGTFASSKRETIWQHFSPGSGTKSVSSGVLDSTGKFDPYTSDG